MSELLLDLYLLILYFVKFGLPLYNKWNVEYKDERLSCCPHFFTFTTTRVLKYLELIFPTLISCVPHQGPPFFKFFI